MNLILNSKGNTIRQSKINDGKLIMENQLEKDVSYNPDFYLWEFGVSSVDMKQIPI